MKTYTLLLFLLIFGSTHVVAQAPQGIPYQAAARNANGNIMANQAINVRFTIHDSIANGTAVYQETHSSTTNAQGMFTLNMGLGTPTTGSFNQINWGSNAKFMQVELSINGGTNYTDMGTQQMMTVPYALYAKNAGNVSNINIPTGGLIGQILTFCNGNLIWTTGGVCPAVLPTVSSNLSFSNITPYTAISGGNISNDGDANITARGVCWSTTNNPTVALTTKTVDGTGTGSFTSSITGLMLSTTYYVRAYATNSVGTAYGNEVSFTTTNTFTIGQSYQGGKVAYILQPGDIGYDSNIIHGLIAAPSDQDPAEWGCIYTGISGADGTAIGTGNQNTIDIMNGCSSAGIAARICGDLVLNGYSDWYLPSINELAKLYENRNAIGGFDEYIYWSSTEYAPGWSPNCCALFHDFSVWGGSDSSTKDDIFNVRAVRSF